MLVAVLEGLAAGAVPGLLGAGLALVHRTTGVLSFAHASLAAAGAYAAWALVPHGSASPSGALFASLGAGVAAAAGAALALPLAPLAARLAQPRMDQADHGEGEARRRAGPVLLTLGYGIGLEALIRAFFGSDPKAFLHIMASERPVLGVPRSAMLTLGLVLVLGGLAALLGRTRLGLSLRATGGRRDAAALLGLPLLRLDRTAWLISGAAAGVSGWLLAPRLGLEPGFMWDPAVAGFVAAALGGLDRPGRALLAGLALGLVERALYLSPLAADASWLRLALFAGLLALRPEKP